MAKSEKEAILRARGAGSTGVQRQGNVILRHARPWTPTVHSLLRHLEEVGFSGAPRVVGSGFAPDGRETLSYIEGEFTHPWPWSIEGAAGVVHLLRKFHEATASYRPPSHAVWPPWFGRSLGGPNRIIGHCDVAAWNIVARSGLPVALIDWETAGPVDPMIELAQACWLNAKLFDDDVAEREGLPSLEVRARQLRAIVDAYGLSTTQRRDMVDLIIGYAIHDAAEQADEFRVTPDMVDPMLDGYPIILTWRARAAAWVYRNRDTLERAIQ
ncbi:MAG: phosphotransferase [Chloroflexota bacterium]|nr:phosphotransferase [Chloroflexota bacterium]MDE2930644.1 phosphotransferase [Chloroflexota bacterium]